MIETTTVLVMVLVAMVIVIVLLLLVLLRKPSAQLEHSLREEQRQGRSELREMLQQSQQQQAGQMQLFAQQLAQFDNATEQQLLRLRESLSTAAQQAREETSAQQARHQQQLSEHIALLSSQTDARLDAFRLALNEDGHKLRTESAQAQQRLAESLSTRVRELSEHSSQQMRDLRNQVQQQLAALQADNAQKLEQMRATVDEKLHTTLETRLGQSFKLVQERLEAVQRGLGEMRQLAADVGSLQRVLSQVKTRGTFGEVQLAALLEQVLVAEQYACNIATVPGASERVEFAIRLPGADDNTPVWLPIDAKFPRESYEQLVQASEDGNRDAQTEAANALERQIRTEAKRIHAKYIAPPHTTDFALLFLPTEGLYAEVIRRPGLFDAIQREHHVTLVGPTTLLALLNALQMGFRTLAIEKRSSDVWQLLGAVKTEFGKFATVLEKASTQLGTVQNSIQQAGVRTRAIERKLRDVEALPLDAHALQLSVDAAHAIDDKDAHPAA